MSPEKARVFLVEDDEESRETAIEFLKIGGHIVVETANSLTQVLEKIPELGKKGVNVAVVDGNLSEMDDSGRDGETVSKAIKAKHPQIIVIGHALKKPINAADINCPKYEGGSKLIDTVRKA